MENSTSLFCSSRLNLILGSAKRLSHGLSQKVKSPSVIAYCIKIQCSCDDLSVNGLERQWALVDEVVCTQHASSRRHIVITLWHLSRWASTQPVTITHQCTSPAVLAGLREITAHHSPGMSSLLHRCVIPQVCRLVNYTCEKYCQ